MTFHKGMTSAKWSALPWDKKILNITSELVRVKKGIEENNDERADRALERAFELIDLTVEGGANGKSPFILRELLRLRECLAAFYSSREKNEREFTVLMRGLLDLDSVCHHLKLEI